MFDVIVTGHRHTPHSDSGPFVLSLAVHSIVIAILIGIPLLLVSAPVRQLPRMVAFVAAPPLPPPPPPSVPKAEPAKAPPKTPQAAQVAMENVPSPAALPPTVEPEAGEDEGEAWFDGPVAAESGIPGGVVGGIVPDILPPPPPPPPSEPPKPTTPVRVGGSIPQPALLTRVDPVYPPAAVAARITGVVVLEATVDRDGRVQSVKVLRSIPAFDRAAADAVRQWTYEPLLLNGQPVPFILTVTMTFGLS